MRYAQNQEVAVDSHYASPADNTFPRLICGTGENRSLDRYASRFRADIDGWLITHGAVLFRDFDVKGVRHLGKV